MKRTLLSLAIAALSVGGLAGCASTMRTGESIIRGMTPENGGILTMAGNVAADTYRQARGIAFGDYTTVENDPAKGKVGQ